MRLLLDTHIWLWSLVAPRHLTPQVAGELEESSNELWLSPISVWETLLLVEKGRIELTREPLAWLDDVLRAFPLRDATLTREVAVRSRSLDVSHEDPADRFIAASAIVHELTLVTADQRLLGSKQYGSLPNHQA